MHDHNAQALVVSGSLLCEHSFKHALLVYCAACRRFVVTPTAAVNLAALARLRLTAATVEAPVGDAPTQGGTVPPPLQLWQSSVADSSSSGSTASSSTDKAGHGKCGLSFALQLFDTAGAKEVAWHGKYQLLASVQSGADGCVSIPNLHLGPGKYLVVLQLLTEGSRQWVDPTTGSTSPLPEWQLQLVPGADDKVCPITEDDSYERHFEATMDAWQQQAVAAVTAAATAAASAVGPGRPVSSNASRVALAAAKERAKTAQAALERHLAAATAAAAEPAASALSTAASGVPATAPSTARSALAAPSSTPNSTSAQQAPAAAHGAGNAVSAAARKVAAAAVASAAKGKAGAHHAPAAGRPSTPMCAAAAGGTAGAAAPMGDVDDSSSSSSSGYQQAKPEHVWPGALPAAAAPAKQPTEVMIRQVKNAAADVLQLSPADQLRLVKQQQQPQAGSASPSSDFVSASRGLALGGGMAVLTPAAMAVRLEQLQAAAASKADVVAKAASSRGQLQAAAAQRAEQQVGCRTCLQRCHTQQCMLPCMPCTHDLHSPFKLNGFVYAYTYVCMHELHPVPWLRKLLLAPPT